MDVRTRNALIVVGMTLATEAAIRFINGAPPEQLSRRRSEPEPDEEPKNEIEPVDIFDDEIPPEEEFDDELGPEEGFEDEVMGYDPLEDKISLETLGTLIKSPDYKMAEAAKDILIRRFMRLPEAYKLIAADIAGDDERLRETALVALNLVSGYSSNGTRHNQPSNSSNNSPIGANNVVMALEEPIRWSGLCEFEEMTKRWNPTTALATSYEQLHSIQL